MKYYIRVKETIFEVVGENTKTLIVRAKGNPNHLYNKSRIQTEILQQADTIEELCDEYCLKGSDGTRLVYNRSDFADLKKNILSNNGWTEIYGAIWTPKGLIYVAKMNEDGELVLL